MTHPPHPTLRVDKKSYAILVTCNSATRVHQFSNTCAFIEVTRVQPTLPAAQNIFLRYTKYLFTQHKKIPTSQERSGDV